METLTLGGVLIRSLAFVLSSVIRSQSTVGWLGPRKKGCDLRVEGMRNSRVGGIPFLLYVFLNIVQS